MVRRDSRVDANQAEIVDALRAVGATVHLIRTVRKGCPDLLVGFRRETYLMETKTEEGKLNDGQVEWHSNWEGRPVYVVRTIEHAWHIIGADVEPQDG